LRVSLCFFAKQTSHLSKFALQIACVLFSKNVKCFFCILAFKSVIREGKIGMVRRSVLESIFREMVNIRQRLDDIENSFSSWKPQPVDLPESELIALPDHLRKTFVVVSSKGECSAVQVSNLTGRCRAIESNYLNQLSRMGWLNKRRISKTVQFRLMSETDVRKTAAISVSNKKFGNLLR